MDAAAAAGEEVPLLGLLLCFSIVSAAAAAAAGEVPLLGLLFYFLVIVLAAAAEAAEEVPLIGLLFIFGRFGGCGGGSSRRSQGQILFGEKRPPQSENRFENDG